jgi:peptidoglycan/xylan/chitin deacetylase (PgdA/CDA1 family)
MTDGDHRDALAGPLRDYVGYGRTPPRFAWPDGAKVVINVVINYEAGAEASLYEGDGRNDGWGEYPDVLPPNRRDLGTESQFEYGSRVGIWRLARVFDERALPVTIGACGRALERNPEVASWITERGHDVAGHGWRWAEVSEMTREQERDDLLRALESFERLLGTRPLGWYTRSQPSVHTRELMIEVGSFLYESNACNDDLPYYVSVGSARLLVVPYTHVHNDERYFIPPTYASPHDFEALLRSALDYLWDEADTVGPRMMSVGLHERWSGQAARASAVRDFIDYALDKPEVSFMRRADIARWFDQQQHPITH